MEAVEEPGQKKASKVSTSARADESEMGFDKHVTSELSVGNSFDTEIQLFLDFLFDSFIFDLRQLFLTEFASVELLSRL